MIYEREVSIFKEEALSNKFHSIQTSFDVTLGKIAAIISDSEIQEYVDGHTTMNTRLSSTIQDLDGVHTQISSMQTDYDSGFENINSKITKLDTTLDGILASVSGTYGGTLSTDVIHYLATPNRNVVDASDSGWTTTVPTLTSTNKYLWVYHTYTYSSGDSHNTAPVLVYTYTDGTVSVSAVTPIHYLSNSSNYPVKPSSRISSSSTTAGAWTTAVPTTTSSNKYLYVCDQIEFSNNTNRWTDVTCVTQLSALDQRVSTAELKITDSAIMSTVQSYTPSAQGDPVSMASYIVQQAGSIRLQASTISWDSTYSSMTSAGVLTCEGANINGVLTTESGNWKMVFDSSKINAYYNDSDRFEIGGVHWTTSNNATSSSKLYGVSLIVANSGGFVSLAKKNPDNNGSTAVILINNGLNPSSYTEDAIVIGSIRITGNTYLSNVKGAKLEGPVKFSESGSVSATITDYEEGQYITHINFTSGVFSSYIPIVFLSVQLSSPFSHGSTMLQSVAAYAYNVTYSGFDLYVSGQPGTYAVNWLALATGVTW